MKRFFALLFVALVAITPARAALLYDGYPTGPGGLSIPETVLAGDPQVYAGFIEFNYDGVTLLTMSDDYNARTNVGVSGTAHYYTYADVMAGAPVRFSPVQYSRAASHLYFEFLSYLDMDIPGFTPTIQQLAASLGGWGDNSVYLLAAINNRIWGTMNFGVNYAYYIPGADSFDWSQVMVVATTNGLGGDEYLIPLLGQNITIANAPLPSAFWLLGSGLLGLAGVARKRHGAPR